MYAGKPFGQNKKASFNQINFGFIELKDVLDKLPKPSF